MLRQSGYVPFVVGGKDSDTDTSDDDADSLFSPAAAAAAAASAAEDDYDDEADERRFLIFDAEALARRHAYEEETRRQFSDPGVHCGIFRPGLFAVDEPVDDLAGRAADDLSTHLARLNMTAFEERPLEFVVQFFDDAGRFLWETHPQTAFPSLLAKYHNNKSTTPLSMRYEIIPDEDEQTRRMGGAAASAAASAAAAAAAVAGGSSTPPDDLLLDSAIPDSGYIVIIVTVCGTDQVLVGFHREQFSFVDGASVHSSRDRVHLDTFRVGGKRVAWRESELSGKRARYDDAEDVSRRETAADADADDDPASAAAAAAAASQVSIPADEPADASQPANFAMDPSETHEVWESSASPMDLKLFVSRHRRTRNVHEIRLAINLHIKRVRDELRAIFHHPENHYPEVQDDAGIE